MCEAGALSGLITRTVALAVVLKQAGARHKNVAAPSDWAAIAELLNRHVYFFVFYRLLVPEQGRGRD